MQNETQVSAISPGTSDYRDLERAVSLLVSPTLTARITSMVGKPLERLLEYVPAGLEKNLNRLVEGALSKAADAALWSLDNKPRAASPWLNKAYAAASGGVGGFFGFTGLAVELPVSTTILMRAVADVARSEGFDLSELDTKRACIEVFALGGETEQDDQAETTYYAMRLFTTESVGFIAKELAAMASKEATGKMTSSQAGAWLALVIKKVASRFGIAITEKAAAQAVPLIGAAGGAAINVMFTGFYQDMARGHFIVKRLEKQYGFEVVKQEFENIRKRLSAQ
ncbi:EcsC protein family [Bordetella ansorpii]|uniref:EcsC protein family n=1 Tax=Bordetella ansorpii TaxID=288768 RepID=A0A157Q077_9BORD|nr:EcsC family protein [Bordetella ansorpii]SAI39028.1 EcsC protein family [Bordetella ansorpii]